MDIPYINNRLAGSPINWAIVGVIATLWLLLFHVVMSGFGTMQGNVAVSAGAGPGQIPAPGTSTAGPQAYAGGYSGIGSDYEPEYAYNG